MINYVYQLVTPQFFSIKMDEVDIAGKVVVRPKFMSICHADQRYYQGNRDSQVLDEKLPMALIHECSGVVLEDRSGCFKVGQEVVMIPNMIQRKLGHIYENYDEMSVFLSSGGNGFMREFVDLPADRVIPCDGIPLNIACLCEFYSVAVHAVNRMLSCAHEQRDNIAIWGDGSLSYVIASAIKVKLPDAKVTVIGRNMRKLSRFSFVNKTYLSYSLPKEFTFDHAFECAGGEGSYEAINEIIEHIKPQGSVVMLGVSENKVAINTRMLLEKGLTVVGSSRSGKQDFEESVELMRTQRIRRRLGSIIFEDEPVKSIDDIHRVFATDLNTPFKTVFNWKL
ncbi:alcohol dehydrogenase [Clostridia bacterium]|nr:alcohol dehydrogenase [Clostridia bacterium]